MKEAEPPAIVRISTNTIFNGKFYLRGEPLPFSRVEDLPPNLKGLVISGEPDEAEGPNEPRGSFQTGVIYEMTPDGRLGRALKRQVERQVAELEADNEFEQWVEAQANTGLPPQVAESLRQEHENAVSYATAQAAADARRADDIAAAAIAAAEPAELFVLRAGRHYVPIDKARLKPDEPVFVKGADGYEFIGETDGKGSPPDIPLTL
jgi:hypothetical protein